MCEERHVQIRGRHPWTGKPGFDTAEVLATTQGELDLAIAELKKDHWHVWICGRSEAHGGCPGAFLYRPTGITGPWVDTPEEPYRYD